MPLYSVSPFGLSFDFLLRANPHRVFIVTRHIGGLIFYMCNLLMIWPSVLLLIDDVSYLRRVSRHECPPSCVDRE